MPIVVRVRWSGGYVEVEGPPDSQPRRSIAFDAGEVRSAAKARVVGEKVLQDYTEGRVTYDAQIAATNDWPGVGDRILFESYVGQETVIPEVRLQSRRVAFDSTGYITLEPTLGTRRELLVERNQKALSKLTDGTRGRSAASDPLLVEKDTGFASGQMTEQTVITWSNSTLLEESSPVQTLSETAVLTRLQMLLTSNDVNSNTATHPMLTAPVTLSVYINDQSQGPLTFPAMTLEYNWLIANAWPGGTKIFVRLIEANPANSNTLLNRLALTVNLFAVTGTWVQETKNEPELR